MAFKDGRLFMPFGTPGGDVQQQAMLQVLLNIAVFGMLPQPAVEAPRVATRSFPDSFWPHKAFPGQMNLEARIPSAVADDLVVLPLQPSPYDLWAASETLSTLALADSIRAQLGLAPAPRLAVLNRVQVGTRIGRQARAAVAAVAEKDTREVERAISGHKRVVTLAPTQDSFRALARLQLDRGQPAAAVPVDARWPVEKQGVPEVEGDDRDAHALRPGTSAAASRGTRSSPRAARPRRRRRRTR
jgi:hypothetical protein